MSRKVAVLGSTGSIGVQALEVISQSKSLYLDSVVCGSAIDKLEAQKQKYSPKYAACAKENKNIDEILYQVIDSSDIVLNAIVGSAGLKASLIAQELNKPLALANKESLVIGSELLRNHLSNGLVIPVDSEHSTIFRCLQGEARPVKSITLTASGGALRSIPIEEIYSATPEQVLNHPTWNMGGRITVDSASMVNKAFEVIEARALFPGIPIDVVIHKSSIVHSFIESADGAWKALMGLPDMKVPIAWALNYPNLPTDTIASEKPTDWGELSFTKMEEKKYPAFYSVLYAGEKGGIVPTAANAADEVAVDAFLHQRLSFGDIATVIREVVNSTEAEPVKDFNHIQSVDTSARIYARKVVNEICSQ